MGNRLHILTNAALTVRQDQVKSGSFFQRYMALLRKGMSSRHKDDETISKQRNGEQIRICSMPRTDPEVDLALQHGFTNPFRNDVPDLDTNAGMVFSETLDQSRKNTCRHCGKRCYRDRTSGSRTQLMSVIDDRLRIVEQAL